MLIAALLEHWQLLPEPLLYMSGYLKARQNDYYRHLSAIRTHGDWEAWVAFFLEGVEASAEQAQRSIVAIAALIAADRKRVLGTGSSTLQALRLFEFLPTMPKLTVDRAQQALEVSYPTARAAVTTLQDIGVLVETTGRARGQSFSYQAYVNLLRA